MPPPTDVRERLLVFYVSYNPAKIPLLDSIIAEYPDIDELFGALEKQYGPEPWKLRPDQKGTLRAGKTQEAALDRGKEILQGLRHDNASLQKDVTQREMQVLQVRIQRGIQHAILSATGTSATKLITLSIHDEKENMFVPAQETLWTFLQHAAGGSFTRGIEITRSPSQNCTMRSSHTDMSLLMGAHLIALILREWSAVCPHTVTIQSSEGLQYFPGDSWWRKWPIPVLPSSSARVPPMNVERGRDQQRTPQSVYFDERHAVSPKPRAVVKDAEVSKVMMAEPSAAVIGTNYWSYFVDEWELLTKEMSNIARKSDFFGKVMKDVKAPIPLDEL